MAKRDIEFRVDGEATDWNKFRRRRKAKFRSGYISAASAKQNFRLDPATLTTLRKDRLLKAEKRGNRWYYSITGIEDLLKQGHSI